MIVLATFALALVASCQATGEKLSFTIHQSGFHRILRYDSFFMQPWRTESCDFILEQIIPAGAYVDTDQLDDLVRLNELVYYTSARPNVEAIASNSEPFKLYVYGDTGTPNTIDVPVHFRYHLAGDQSFVRVPIEPPYMFLNCSSTPPESQLPSFEHLSTKVADTIRMLPCKNAAKSLCMWQHVVYDWHSDPIVVSLPIGSQAVEPLVTFVTLALAWAACYYIGLAVYNKGAELELRI